MHLDPSMMHDRHCVVEQVHRLFWGIDARDGETIAAACSPEVSSDWEGCEAGSFPAAILARLAGVLTHHQCSNDIVSLAGNRATVELLVVARHRRATLRGADSFTRLSSDRITLRSHGGIWRVTALQREHRGAEGNPGVLVGGGTAEPAAQTLPLPPEPPVTSVHEQLARLADHQEIHDLMMRFGRGLDSKDWALYRSCFADRVIVDFGQSTGHAARFVSADGFVAFARMRQRGHTAFHQYSNFQASVTGDHARCILYMMARHRVTGIDGDPLNIFVGWYDNEFIRTPQGWRISKLRHPLQWIEGNAAIKDAPDPEAEAIGRQLFGSSEEA